MTSLQESILVSFADWNKPGSVPRWARGFNTQRSTVSEISEADHLPGIIVLKAPTTKILDFLRELWAYADRTYFQTMVNLIT